MLKFQRNRAKPELIRIFFATSLNCLRCEKKRQSPIATASMTWSDGLVKKKTRIISWELKIEWEHLFKMFFLVIYMEKLYRWASKENETKNSRIAHNKLIVTAIYSATGAQAHNARRYIIFFLLLCERSAKRDMWHILLHNKRNVTLASQHMEVLYYNGLNL